MFAYIKGRVTYRTSTEVHIECNGVGWQVLVSLNTSEKISLNEENTKLLTVFIPGENSFTLYGFYEEQERELFKMLTSVSGVGPRTSMGILSSVTAELFRDYIISNNLYALQKLPGIGKKTAERLVVELKDKIIKLHVPGEQTISGLNSLRQESVMALISLGYSSQVAERAVRQVISDSIDEEGTIETIIKRALKYVVG